MAGRKMGAGHFQGWFRQGGKELAQALPAFPDSVRVVEEPGVFGNLTPQEIVDGKGKESDYDKHLNDLAREAQANEPVRDDLEFER